MAAAAVQHASSAVLPAAVVSAFCGRWKKESRPGSVSQDPKEEKKKNQTDLLPARFGRKETETEKKRGGGGHYYLPFPPFVAVVYAPGKRKSHFDICRERDNLFVKIYSQKR